MHRLVILVVAFSLLPSSAFAQYHRVPQYPTVNLPINPPVGAQSTVTDGAAADALLVGDGTNWNCDAAKSQKLIIVTCPPYNAKGDNATDDRAALAAADTAATSTGTLVLPKGTYTISSNLTLSASTRFSRGAVLGPAMGVVVTLNGAIQAGLYQIFTTGAGTFAIAHNAAEVVYAAWWGAVLDGFTDDTVPIAAAAAAVGNQPGSSSFKGGRVRVTGPTKTGDLSLNDLGAWRLIEFVGQWTVTATMDVPTRNAFIGRTGGSPGQFQNKPSATFVAGNGSNVTPVLRTSSVGGPVYLANMSIIGTNVAGPVLQTRSSNVYLENVTVSNAQTGIDAIAWQAQDLGGGNWIYAENSNFGVSSTTSGAYSISFEPTATGFGPVDFRNIVISGRGMRMVTGPSNRGFGSWTIKNMLYESGHNEMFTLDATNYTFTSMFFENISVADAVAVPTVFSLIGLGSNFRGLTFVNVGLDTGLPLFSNTAPSIAGLHVLGGGRTIDYSDAWGFGSGQREYGVTWGGFSDARNPTMHTPMSPSVVPITAENLNQDPTSWPVTPVTITTGIVGPDGSTKAATLSAASPKNVTIYTKAVTPGVGDWVIAGMWVRQEGTSYNDQNVLAWQDSTTKWDINNSSTLPLSEQYSNRLASSGGTWAPLAVAAKVSVSGGGPTNLQYKLGADSSKTNSVFMPFLFYVPASAGYSDAEIIRWARSLIAIPAAAVAGHYTTYAHLPLDLGNKFTRYNNAAPTDGQLLIGGTAAGNFTAGILGAGTNIAVTNGNNTVSVATVNNPTFSTSVTTPTTVLSATHFANLGTPANGTLAFCDDCDPPTLVDSTCTSAGAKTGSLAFRVAGAWKCLG